MERTNTPAYNTTSIKYHPPLVFVYDNTVVRVHRPILTDAERAERMERIKEAAANLLYEAEKAHKS